MGCIWKYFFFQPRKLLSSFKIWQFGEKGFRGTDSCLLNWGAVEAVSQLGRVRKSTQWGRLPGHFPSETSLCSFPLLSKHTFPFPHLPGHYRVWNCPSEGEWVVAVLKGKRMLCLQLKLDLSRSCPDGFLGVFCSWEASGRILSFSRPVPEWKREGFLPVAFSWAPQDRVSLEIKFTIQPSTLFAHITPTVILLNCGCGYKARGLAKAGWQDIIVPQTKPSKSF